MKSRAVLYAAIAAMVLFWSGNYVAGKIALRDFPPLVLMGMRLSIAGVLILPVYLWQRGRGGAQWKLRDVPMLVYLGLFGVALNQVLFVIGLQHTTVAHSVLIVSMTPILVLIMCAAMGLERLTVTKIVGMLIATAGVLILKWSEPTTGGGATQFGDGFVLLAALVFAAFTAFGKKTAAHHSPITVNTFAYAGGALAFFPVTVWQSRGFAFARVTTAAWASVFYMAAFASVFCYLIYYHALERIAASRMSALSYLQPPLATLFAVFLLNEHLTAPLLISGVVISAGVYITERG